MLIAQKLLDFRIRSDFEILSVRIDKPDVRASRERRVVLYRSKLFHPRADVAQRIGNTHENIVGDDGILRHQCIHTGFVGLAAVRPCLRAKRHIHQFRIFLAPDRLVEALVAFQCRPLGVVVAVRNASRVHGPSLAAVVVMDAFSVCPAVDLDVVLEMVVASAAHQRRVPGDIHEQVVRDERAARHIVDVDGSRTRSAAGGQVMNIIVLDFHAAVRPRPDGIDRADVRCLGADVENLIAEDRVVVSIIADRHMRRVIHFIAVHGIAASHNGDGRRIRPLRDREVFKIAVFHTVVTGGQREPIAAAEIDAALSRALDVTALDRIVASAVRAGVDIFIRAADRSHHNGALPQICKAASGHQRMMAVYEFDPVAVSFCHFKILELNILHVFRPDEALAHHGQLDRASAEILFRIKIQFSRLSVQIPFTGHIDLTQEVVDVEFLRIAAAHAVTGGLLRAHFESATGFFQRLERYIVVGICPAKIAGHPDIGFLAPKIVLASQVVDRPDAAGLVNPVLLADRAGDAIAAAIQLCALRACAVRIRHVAARDKAFVLHT